MKPSPTRLTLLLAICLGLSPAPAPAQWSHKEGDPRPSNAADHLVQPFTAAEWNASNFAPDEDLQWFRDAKFGMFVHFGLSTRVNQELSWGTCGERKPPDAGKGPYPFEEWTAWADDFRFEKFDAAEWVDIAKRGGFRYLVAIAKHHEGFHLWNTDQSDFKVTRTPFARDYLKELAEACEEAGMPFGIYYSQRDWYHPDYMPVDPAKVERNGTRWTLKPGETHPMGERHARYNEYQFKVVRELCTRYGELDLFWWDAAWWGGMFTPEMWDAERLTRMVRELQPHILQNNRCSVPGDFDTPEQRLGAYQDWRPWESCMCLTRTWCYSGTPPKSRNQVLTMLINNACGDGNVLLSWGPKWDGSFAEAERQRLAEVGDWLQQHGRSIYGTRGGPWKPGTWGGSTRKGSSVFLHVLKWPGDTLRLPALPGRRVVSAHRLDGGSVAVTESGDSIELALSETERDAFDTIIELTMDGPVDALPPLGSAAPSIFNDTVTYGEVVSRGARVTTSSSGSADPPDAPRLLVAEHPAERFAFHTTAEASPWVEIDLGSIMPVTGLRILNRTDAGEAGEARASTLRLEVSRDGTSWTEMWKASRAEAVWEVPVTAYTAGAHIPGRPVRYLRLATRPETPTPLHLRQVEVWGRPE